MDQKIQKEEEEEEERKRERNKMKKYMSTVLSVITCFAAVVLVIGKDLKFASDIHRMITAELHLAIDLGTTFSVAAVCFQGEVSVIEVDGHRTTPSTVWFSKGIKVGREAVKARSKDPKNVIYGAKRIMGVSFDDPEKDNKLEGLPFDFAPVQEIGEWQGNIGYELGKKGRVISPEQIGALVLKKLKHAAEKSPILDSVRRLFGFNFKSLTVSVPVTFSDEAKRATIRACKMAGFRQVRLLEEPVAAALAYNLDKKKETNQVLLVDAGGGTIDLASLFFSNVTNTFYVDHTDGETQGAGQDLDVAVADLILSKLQEKDAAYADQVRTSPSVYQKLLLVAEDAKRKLSYEESTFVCLPRVATTTKSDQDSCEYEIIITRNEFEIAAKQIFERMLMPLKRIMIDGQISHDAELDIVFAGGTSRIPYFRNQVASLLPKARLHYEAVNPDEAIAIGAAKSWGCNHQD